MAKLDINSMKTYLSSCTNSLNQNKIDEMLAEIELRTILINLGFSDRISQSGWITWKVSIGGFGHNTIIVFPQTIQSEIDYSVGRQLEDPPMPLHTICSTIHQIGVHSFYCVPSIEIDNDTSSISWHTKQLGIPNVSPYAPLIPTIHNFGDRGRRYNFLRYHTNSDLVPIQSLPEEFTKEHLRVYFQNQFMCEMSDIDGIIWGQQYTYPIEIKEKTAGNDPKVGAYFGIDVGPFVKLAFYAAKKGSLHSLFFVREINNTVERQLVNWWFITFDKLAQFASWVPIGGGTNMQGGGSTVVLVPKEEFSPLTAATLAAL